MKIHKLLLRIKWQIPFICMFAYTLFAYLPLKGQDGGKPKHVKTPAEISINKDPCPDIFFEDIGDLPGDCISSLPSDISSDGKRVVLSSSADDPTVPNDGGSCDPWLGWPHSNQAAGWTRPCKGKSFFNTSTVSGLVGFGYLSGGSAPHAESLARGISPDGKVVVGYSNFKPDNNIKSVVFTSAGIQELALLDSGCIAIDVSQKFLSPPNCFSDIILKGRVIVGYSNIYNQYAIRLPGAKAIYWDNWNHVVELPLPATLPNDSIVISSEAVAISDNGKIIVGNLYYNQKMNPLHYMSYGCVWIYNPQNAWQNRYDLLCVLDDLPGGDNNSIVKSISGNGLVIVGNGSQYTGNNTCWDYYSTACKWEINNLYSNPTCSGISSLPGLSGYQGSTANGASYDGSVIVGAVTNITGTCSFPEFNLRPTRWVASSQNQYPEDIWTVMNSFIPSNWVLFDAIRVSADGNTVIGYGMDYDYNIVGWVTGLPPGTSQLKEGNYLVNEMAVTVFPNPAIESFGVNFYSNSNCEAILEFRDITGRLVKSTSVVDISYGKNEITVDAGGIAKGSYILTITAGDWIGKSIIILQ